jgi:hypothetical protein
MHSPNTRKEKGVRGEKKKIAFQFPFFIFAIIEIDLCMNKDCAKR